MGGLRTVQMRTVPASKWGRVQASPSEGLFLSTHIFVVISYTSIQVQNHWITSAHKPKTSWAAHTIAAIHLREEHHREPADEEIEQLVTRYKAKKALPSLFLKVSQERVQQAFNSGEEVISFIRLNVYDMQ